MGIIMRIFAARCKRAFKCEKCKAGIMTGGREGPA